MNPPTNPELNAYDLAFAEIEIQRNSALFTEARVRLDSIPLPLAKYEMRCADEDKGQNATVRESVDDNFFGTIITQRALELNNFAEVELVDSCIDFYPRTLTTLSEFLIDNNLAAKARSQECTRSLGYVEFKDGFVGDSEYGYHPSLDGSQLMRDGDIVAYVKGLETDKHVFFHRKGQITQREEEFVLFQKTEGALTELAFVEHYIAGDLSDTLEDIWKRTNPEPVVFIDEFMRDYLTKAESDFGWSMPYAEPDQTSFTVINILDTRALFTEKTIRREAVSKSLFVFEVGDDIDGPPGAFKVAKNIYVNFKGTLITERALNLDAQGHVYIPSDVFSAQLDKPLTLKQFCREASARAHPKKHYER